MANDFVCGIRKTADMSERERIASDIRAKFERTGKAKKDLAKALGLDNSAISRILDGQRDVKAHEMDIIEAFFDHRDDVVLNDRAEIGEIDVRGGMGGGGTNPEDYYSPDGKGGMMAVDNVKAKWVLPPAFVRNNLGTFADKTAIIEVLGDSMLPTLYPGDRVFIDMNHTNPSPPGMFALWDGFGIVVKRVELVPLTEPPMVKLISDNPRHETYTVSLVDAHIVGRIAGRMTTY